MYQPQEYGEPIDGGDKCGNFFGYLSVMNIYIYYLAILHNSQLQTTNTKIYSAQDILT
jgi:hypothetical protein